MVIKHSLFHESFAFHTTNSCGVEIHLLIKTMNYSVIEVRHYERELINIKLSFVKFHLLIVRIRSANMNYENVSKLN